MSAGTIDLKKASGLPLKLNGSKLSSGKGMKKIVPEARTRERMKAVLKSPSAKAPKHFYYMYRDVAMEKDRAKIRANNLRYDITILPAFKAGGEFNKTFGHFHPKKPGTKTWFPEVYEVLHGHARYLLQNGKEFLVYDAEQGDKCLMLPGFAHATVNASEKDVLVMANWVFPGFKSDYRPVEKKGGMQWLYTGKGFEKNGRYKKVPDVKKISPKNFAEFGFTEKPIYSEAIKSPKKFEFLWKPEKYLKEFRKYRKE